MIGPGREAMHMAGVPDDVLEVFGDLEFHLNMSGHRGRDIVRYLAYELHRLVRLHAVDVPADLTAKIGQALATAHRRGIEDWAATERRKAEITKQMRLSDAKAADAFERANTAAARGDD